PVTAITDPFTCMLILLRLSRVGASGCAASEQFEDGGVGQAAGLAHGLEPISDAGGTHVVHEPRHENGARTAERMADRDSPAEWVEPILLGARLREPGERN